MSVIYHLSSASSITSQNSTVTINSNSLQQYKLVTIRDFLHTNYIVLIYCWASHLPKLHQNLFLLTGFPRDLVSARRAREPHKSPPRHPEATARIRPQALQQAIFWTTKMFKVG